MEHARSARRVGDHVDCERRFSFVSCLCFEIYFCLHSAVEKFRMRLMLQAVFSKSGRFLLAFGAEVFVLS